MKLRRSLLLVLALSLVTWLSISERLVAQPSNLDKEKKQLEVEKLKVEIEQMKDSALDEQKKKAEVDKLKKEIEQITIQQQQSWITLFATIGGSIIGAFGLGWTVWSGLKTFGQQIQETRQNRISSLLQSLSSQEEYSRLGASKGLSQYADYCVIELLTSSSREDSVLVRQNLEDTLSLVSSMGKKQVVKSNSITLLERLEIAGQIKVLEANDKAINIETNKLLELSEKSLTKLRKAFNVQYEYGQKIARLYLKNLEGIRLTDSIQTYMTENIESKTAYLRKLNQMTGSVIAIWLRKGIKLEGIDSGIDLSATNLYRAKIPGLNGLGCIFNYTLMRHCDLSKGRFDKCIFYDADMYGSNLNQCNFKDSDFSNTNLRNASGTGLLLNNCLLVNVTLSEANLTKASFRKTNLETAKLKGAILEKCRFVEAKLNKAELQDAKLNKSVFEEVTLFGAKMINTNLSNSHISNTKFNGADLRGADFSKSILKNVDFSGANVSGAKFTGTKLENVNMDHARELSNAIGLNVALRSPRPWWQFLKDLFN